MPSPKSKKPILEKKQKRTPRGVLFIQQILRVKFTNNRKIMEKLKEKGISLKDLETNFISGLVTFLKNKGFSEEKISQTINGTAKLTPEEIEHIKRNCAPLFQKTYLVLLKEAQGLQKTPLDKTTYGKVVEGNKSPLISEQARERFRELLKQEIEKAGETKSNNKRKYISNIRTKRILSLYFISNLSFSDIARNTGLTRQAVEAIIKRFNLDFIRKHRRRLKQENLDSII